MLQKVGKPALLYRFIASTSSHEIPGTDGMGLIVDLSHYRKAVGQSSFVELHILDSLGSLY
jgi:hypothetical protein